MYVTVSEHVGNYLTVCANVWNWFPLKPLNTDIVMQSPLQISIKLVIMVELFPPEYLVRQVFECELNV